MAAGMLTKLSGEQRVEIVQVFEVFRKGQQVQVWLPLSATTTPTLGLAGAVSTAAASAVKAAARRGQGGRGGEGEGRERVASDVGTGKWWQGRVTAVARVKKGLRGRECGTCHRYHGACYAVEYGEGVGVDEAVSGSSSSSSRICRSRHRGRKKALIATSVCPFHMRSHCLRRNEGGKRRSERGSKGKRRGKERGQKGEARGGKRAAHNEGGAEDDDGVAITPSMDGGNLAADGGSSSCCCGGKRQGRSRPSVKEELYRELVDQRDEKGGEDYDDEEEEEEEVSGAQYTF
jgi:hypothetical protein